MASTYSDLKIELITNGEQSGTWGTTTNTNLGTALEEAIVGRATANFTANSDLTITLTNTNTTQVARHYILNVTSGVSLTATRNLIVPTTDKPYIIENNTTGGQSIVVKTTAGSGVTVPSGKKVMVYANSINVVAAMDHLPALSLTTDLAVADGGTGASNAASARTNLDVPSRSGADASGTWGINVTGNAGTATTLQTARTIGGVSFNGSANINLPGVNTAGNQNTSGNATTATTATNATNLSGGTVSATTGTFSGVASFAAGTAAAPSITRTGDTNTGIYFPGADQVAVSLDGTERVYLNGGNFIVKTRFTEFFTDISQQVTIASAFEGDTNGRATLIIDADKFGGTGNNPRLVLDTGAEIGGSNIFETSNNYDLRLGTQNQERMRIRTNGNVGIGTSLPAASALLDVQSTTKGVRMPNMTTTQKNAIVSPAVGLMVFDTTLGKLSVRTASAWETISSS